MAQHEDRTINELFPSTFGFVLFLELNGVFFHRIRFLCSSYLPVMQVLSVMWSSHQDMPVASLLNRMYIMLAVSFPLLCTYEAKIDLWF